ncbi:MAG: hypothetical protein IPN29_05395 [Saprospiraceae bacterium]|nr:hypothetical protein [Saprospiraceae bacterium]
MKYNTALWVMVFFLGQLRGQSLYSNDACLTAYPILQDTVIDGYFGFMGLDEIHCNVPGTRGIWYRIHGQDDIISVDLQSNSSQLKLAVFTGSCDTLNCTMQEDRIFFSKAGFTYYVFLHAESHEFPNSDFTLKVNRSVAHPADRCVTAPRMNCGDSLVIPLLTKEVWADGGEKYLAWMVIEGQGDDIHLSWNAADLPESALLFFNSTACEDTAFHKMETANGSYTFSAAALKDYLVAIDVGASMADTLQINITCSPNTSHNLCERAVVLTCDTLIHDTIHQALIPEGPNEDQRTLWYSIPGDELRHLFDFSKSADSTQIILEVFAADTAFQNPCAHLIQAQPLTSWSNAENMRYLNVRDDLKYFISVSSTDTLPYTLQHDCPDAADVNFSCATADTMQAGDSLFVYFTDFAGGDFCEAYSGTGQWIRFEGSDSLVVLEVKDMPLHTMLRFYENSCDSLVCLREVNEYFEVGDKLYLRTMPGESYFVEIFNKQFAGSWGHLYFSLADTLAGNYFCEAADTLVCGAAVYVETRSSRVVDLVDEHQSPADVRWYEFEGTGDVVKIHGLSDVTYTLYTGQCDSLVAVGLPYGKNNLQDYKFLSHSGTGYKLKVEVDPANITGDTLKIGCEIPDESNACTGAVRLECSYASVLIEDEGASIDTLENLCLHGYADKWLKLTGNGSIITIQSPYAAIFEGSCDSLICVSSGYDDLIFFAADSVEYLISTSALGLLAYQLKITCSEPSSNGYCNDAVALTCDSIYVADFSGSVILSDDDKYQGELWYSFTGEGQNVLLQMQTMLLSPVLVEVWKDSCQGMATLVEHWYNYNDLETYGFFADLGQTYFIRLKTDRRTLLSFDVSCRPMPDGYDCSRAIGFDCADTLVYRPSSGEKFGTLHDAVWYKINLENGTGVLSASTGAWPEGLKVTLLTAHGACDSFETVLDNFSVTSDFYFSHSTERPLYLILGLDHPGDAGDTASFTMQCGALSGAATCGEAIPVQCEETYALAGLQTEGSDFGPCAPNEFGHWFSLTGDSNLWTFDFNTEGTTSLMGVWYEGYGDCDSLVCTSARLVDFSQDSFSFETEAGKTYFHKFVLWNVGTSATLNVGCTEFFPNKDCDQAEEVSCGDTIRGNNFMAQSGSANGCDQVDAALYYRILGDGNYLRISLLEGWQQGAMVNVVERDCKTGRCLVQNETSADNRSVLLDTRVGVEYFIRISSAADLEFVFALSCFEPNENQRCIDATYADCDTKWRCDLETPVGFQGSHPCIGPDGQMQHWFLLPVEDSLYRISLVENSTLPFKVLVLQGNCNFYECIYTYEAGDEIIVRRTNDDDLYLCVYADAQAEGTIELQMTCLEGMINDACVYATELTCNDTLSADLSLAFEGGSPECDYGTGPDVWYTFTGDGRGINFSLTGVSDGFSGYFSLYEGSSCNTLRCQYHDTIQVGTPWSYTLLTQEGKNYRFSLASADDFQSGSLSIQRYCFDKLPQDSCAGALVLNAPGSNEMPLELTTADVVGHCGIDAENGLWYTVAGNGKGLKLRPQTEDTIQFSIFAGSCDSLTCLYAGEATLTRPFDFFTREGETYIILAYVKRGKPKTSLSFEATYFQVTNNDLCIDAAELNCGQFISLRNSQFTPDPFIASSCDEVFVDNVWYKFTGDGNLRTFKYLIPDVDGVVQFMDECFDSCYYRSEFFASLNTEFAFSTIVDKTYVISVGTAEVPENKRVRMEVVCEEGYHHTTRKDALPLSCQQYELDFNKAKINLSGECGNNNQFVQLWYKFTGDGSVLKVKGKPNPGAFFKVVDLECNTVHEFSFAGESFVTEMGKSYYFVVSYFPGIQQTN